MARKVLHVMKSVSLIRGVSPIVPTPFGIGQDVDVASFRRSAHRLFESGVNSVMFPGFGSEFYQLDDAERRELITELVTIRGNSDIAVIASVADNSTHVACRRVAELVDLGIDAINILPPRFQAVPKSAIVEHLAEVIGQTAGLPVIVQYLPDEPWMQLSPGDMTLLASQHHNVFAVKVEKREPESYISALLRGDPALISLVGLGGIDLIPALESGAAGVQPGAGFVEIYLEICRLWDQGDKSGAAELNGRLRPYLEAWISTGVLLQAGKIIGYRRGIYGTPICRSPQATVSSTVQETIDRFLVEFSSELG